MKWRQRRVGDLCKVGRGSSPRPKGDPRYFDNGTIPWIKVADATASGKYVYDTKETVNQFGATFSRLLPIGSLIICTSGTLGLTKFLGVEGCIHDGWLYTYEYDGLDPEFFYYFLQTQQRYFASLASGAAIQNISTEILRNTPINLPELQEQARIASILSAYDDLIENNRRRMTLLEESARLLYQEWFVRLRFPGHEHVRIVNGLPEGWERRTLGDCLTLKRGHDLPEANRVPGTIPIVSSSGITGFHNVKKATGPGLITGRYGTLGEVYYIDEDYWPHNTSLYVCDFKGNSARILYFFLKHALQNAQSNNAAVPGLNRNVLHTLRVLWPPANLREHFDAFLEALFRQLSALRRYNEKTATARDLLLPRLISGEMVI
jgi:type I restriction enzyme, S subunit